MKHFSGTATYTTTFTLPTMQPKDRLFLDLGGVANLADVTVNGKNLGVLWKPPFAVEVTDAVQPGKNTLAIAVTNTWRNRLIGDAALPQINVSDGRCFTIPGLPPIHLSTQPACWAQ